MDRMLYAFMWTWLHLLQFTVSNQSLDPEEDASNKPWRPIPSGLISVGRARALRWILLPSCFFLSVRLQVHWQGISLALAFLVHNEMHLHSHWLMRNACNAWGYASFNAGASAIAAGTFYPPSFHLRLGGTHSEIHHSYQVNQRWPRILRSPLSSMPLSSSRRYTLRTFVTKSATSSWDDGLFRWYGQREAVSGSSWR